MRSVDVKGGSRAAGAALWPPLPLPSAGIFEPSQDQARLPSKPNTMHPLHTQPVDWDRKLLLNGDFWALGLWMLTGCQNS